MALSRKQIRQRGGQEIGIIYTGTATAVDDANDDDISDTSGDSPLDPGDPASLLNGAGVLLHDPAGSGNLVYRRNVTYDPTYQNLRWSGEVSGLTGTPEYEIHTEPLLHPLTVWPRLVDDALALIRRISFQHILLVSGRRYYDLADWTDIDGPEKLRRLYDVGTNLLRNCDFATWATGDNGPDQWTASAALDRVHAENVAQGAQLGDGENVYQDIQHGVASRRLKVVVWGSAGAGATGTLTVTACLADDSSEREVTDTVSASTQKQLTCEIETTPRTSYVRVKLDSSGGTLDVWAPMAYHLSYGQRRRVKPVTAMLADGTMKLYTPSKSGCGQMALLLPYPGLGSTATTTADAVTTAAPDNLILAASIVQVLSWLVQNPQIVDKTEYVNSLHVWESRFQSRIREHMRKIAKTQSVWEAGELA